MIYVYLCRRAKMYSFRPSELRSSFSIIWGNLRTVYLDLGTHGINSNAQLFPATSFILRAADCDFSFSCSSGARPGIEGGVGFCFPDERMISLVHLDQTLTEELYRIFEALHSEYLLLYQAQFESCSCFHCSLQYTLQ